MPSVLAAAIGPGVGGIKTCEIKSPELRANVMATAETAVRRTSALRMGLRITKPESQNTGMETTQPMSCTAMTGFVLPTRRIIMSASFNAPPVFSSTVPIIAPRIMTMPMLVKVPEKPCPIMVARPCCTVPFSSL